MLTKIINYFLNSALHDSYPFRINEYNRWNSVKNREIALEELKNSMTKNKLTKMLFLFLSSFSILYVLKTIGADSGMEISQTLGISLMLLSGALGLFGLIQIPILIFAKLKTDEYLAFLDKRYPFLWVNSIMYILAGIFINLLFLGIVIFIGIEIIGVVFYDEGLLDNFIASLSTIVLFVLFCIIFHSVLSLVSMVIKPPRQTIY